LIRIIYYILFWQLGFIQITTPNLRSGYDQWLPVFTLIIHKVATSWPEPAIVINRDGECNSGDAGPMYTSGEVFADIRNGISVTIDSATETDS
jgi:hypothetical protein